MELPANTCVYERYDPKTLQPANTETGIRLQELGWESADFKGQSVLDIGCNSGLLTLYALRLGATKVHACDVQAPLVEFVTEVVKAHRLPVTIEKRAFKDLDPSKDKADVVLFMEVLHWLVSQGLELRSVIQRLARLTGNILYLELPWSVSEPSIQKQTKLTEEQYSADAVLDELTKYFADVRVVRFMHYFGFHSGSKRVLIAARTKRPEASILEQLPDTYSLNVSLSRGRNESYLLNSPHGVLVAKFLALESPLGKLPKATCNRLFDELHAAKPATLLCPRKHQGEYLLAADAGRFWMLFPFVGRLPSVGKPRSFPIDFDRLIDLFVSVRRDLRPLSSDLLQSLREHGLLRDFRSLVAPNANWMQPGGLEEIKERVSPLLRELVNTPKEHLDALCHGDLQTGNIAVDNENRPHVVDLDTITMGPIYSDGLIGLIWRGVDASVLAKFCDKLRQEEKRAVSSYDVKYAIATGISWFSAVRTLKLETGIPDQVARLRKGLDAAIAFHSSIT